MSGKNRKNSKLIVIGAIVLIVVAVITFARHRAAGNKIVLKTATVKRSTITTSVSGTGTLEALSTVEVKSNVGGQIIWLGVDEGDRVTAGQVVAKIDPTDTKSTLEQSNANLASARAKVLQARNNRDMQHSQYPAQLRAAQEAVKSAKAQLVQAQKQANVQPKLTQEAINEAQSSLASAEASYRQAKKATVPQTLASAKASLNQAKSAEYQTRKELERQKALHDKGFVSKSSLESAQKDYDAAKAQLDDAQSKWDTVQDETNEDLLSSEAKVAAAKAALATAKANSMQVSLKKEALADAQAAYNKAVASLEEVRATYHTEAVKAADITQAEADVKSAEASLEQAQKNVNYTTITAPCSGVVVTKYVEIGSIVTGAKSSAIASGSGVTLFEVADVSKMNATVDIDETDISQINLHQSVNITVDAYPDEVFKGTVTKIAPQTTTTNNVTTIPVTVEISSTDSRLKPGMNTTCDFITASKEDVLVIPNGALKGSNSQSIVMVIKDGAPTPRKIKTGLSGDESTEVISGLKEGEQVVVSDTAATDGNSSQQNMPRPPGGMPM
ncbi:efflux RND transporter periplasmic adaptor subunit [bacterium]|nr:efflux RND transporter periplasmic adaptor subunit [bacterium]